MQKFKQILIPVIILLFVSYLTTETLAASRLNKTHIIFDNGSGFEAVTVNNRPMVRALSKIMAPNGEIIDDKITADNAAFVTSFSSTANLTQAYEKLFLGMIMPFAYPPPESSGWLICDGSYYSNSRLYQELANIIKDKYAQSGDVTGSIVEGDYVGGFRVPDMRGLFVVGTNGTPAGGTIDTADAYAEHTHTFSDIDVTSTSTNPAHSHTWTNGYTNGGLFSGGAGNAHVNLYRGETNIHQRQSDPQTTNHKHDASFNQTNFPNQVITPSLRDSTTLSTEVTPLNAAVIYAIYANTK